MTSSNHRRSDLKLENSRGAPTFPPVCAALSKKKALRELSQCYGMYLRTLVYFNRLERCGRTSLSFHTFLARRNRRFRSFHQCKTSMSGAWSAIIFAGFLRLIEDTHYCCFLGSILRRNSRPRHARGKVRFTRDKTNSIHVAKRAQAAGRRRSAHFSKNLSSERNRVRIRRLRAKSFLF